MSKGGQKSLIFYYQEGDAPVLEGVYIFCRVCVQTCSVRVCVCVSARACIFVRVDVYCVGGRVGGARACVRS